MPFDSVPEPSGFIATSIARTLLARMRRTHERTRVSVFSGPPGIGKSTAIEEFRAEFDGAVTVAPVPPGSGAGLKATAAIQLAIEALQDLSSRSYRERVPSGHVELRAAFFSAICELAGYNAQSARREGVADRPAYTIVFDEAQNLSREAIEVLRFINDERGGYSPFPIGLIFVGNSEFALKADGRGNSVLSAAVADRALYTETFSYADVTNDDLALFFDARAAVDQAAMALILNHFAQRADRSFRRAGDLLDDLTEEAGGGPITTNIVRAVLGLE